MCSRYPAVTICESDSVPELCSALDCRPNHPRRLLTRHAQRLWSHHHRQRSLLALLLMLYSATLVRAPQFTSDADCSACPPKCQRAPPPRPLFALAPPRLDRRTWLGAGRCVAAALMPPTRFPFSLHHLQSTEMSDARVVAKKARRAAKPQVKLFATTEALSSLMDLLGSPTDPDDRLSVRGKALTRLWAAPFTAFVQTMRPGSREMYDAIAALSSKSLRTWRAPSQ